MLCSSKVHANAESSVGLLTLAGRSARILVTSTRDLGRIFSCMHDVKHDGLADVVAGIQKAQLALKHRQNSLQRQRIVVFVSSPIEASKDHLLRLAKTLKKNNVAVDVVNIGLEGENVSKIDAFIAAVNSNDNSHVLHMAAGGQNVADAIINSRICTDPDAAAARGAAAVSGEGGDAGDFGGLDPAAVDPELAMVLRISMEEERARQAARQQAEAAAATEGTTTASADASKSEGGAAATEAPQTTEGSGAADAQGGKYEEGDEDLYGGGEQMEVDEDEEMLRRAIELSKAEAEQAGSADGKEDKDKAS